MKDRLPLIMARFFTAGLVTGFVEYLDFHIVFSPFSTNNVGFFGEKLSKVWFRDYNTSRALCFLYRKPLLGFATSLVLTLSIYAIV